MLEFFACFIASFLISSFIVRSITEKRYSKKEPIINDTENWDEDGDFMPLDDRSILESDVEVKLQEKYDEIFIDMTNNFRKSIINESMKTVSD